MPLGKIKIDTQVARNFPDAAIGWMMADVTVEPQHPYSEELKAALVDNLASRGITGDNLTKQPDIMGWRAIYSAMGAKPSKFRSSLEALTRRVLKDKEMWSVSSVVDTYNCASVMTFLAMGAHDVANIDGDMTLRYCREGEKFYPLGTGGEIVDTDPRNIAYADESKICCWLWNHRDTRLASVTEATKEAVFIVDSGFTPHTTPIEKGLDILAEHLEKIGCKPKERGIICPEL